MMIKMSGAAAYHLCQVGRLDIKTLQPHRVSFCSTRGVAVADDRVIQAQRSTRRFSQTLIHFSAAARQYWSL